MAKAALIFGISGMILNWIPVIGFLFNWLAIIGVVLGAISVYELKLAKQPARIAIAGLVLCLIVVFQQGGGGSSGLFGGILNIFTESVIRSAPIYGVY